MTTADGLKHDILFYSDFTDCAPSAWRPPPWKTSWGKQARSRDPLNWEEISITALVNYEKKNIGGGVDAEIPKELYLQLLNRLSIFSTVEICNVSSVLALHNNLCIT